MSLWRPFTQMQFLIEKKAIPPSLVSFAKGASLFLNEEWESGNHLQRNTEKVKTKATKEVLDAISSWWVITHGHCEPSIMKAIQEQAPYLDQVLFANFTHEPAEKLYKALKAFLLKRTKAMTARRPIAEKGDSAPLPSNPSNPAKPSSPAKTLQSLQTLQNP